MSSITLLSHFRQPKSRPCQWVLNSGIAPKTNGLHTPIQFEYLVNQTHLFSTSPQEFKHFKSTVLDYCHRIC